MKAVSAHTVAPVAITSAARGIRTTSIKATMERSPRHKPRLDGVVWAYLNPQQRKAYLYENAI